MSYNKFYEKLNGLIAMELFDYKGSLEAVEAEFSAEYMYLTNMTLEVFSKEEERSMFEILRLLDIYFRNGKPLMTDSFYDGLFKVYQEKSGDTAEVIQFEPSIDSWEKCEHEMVMGSLDKASTVEEIEKWNAKKNIHGLPSFVSEKLDGISCLHKSSNIDLIDGTQKTIKEIVDKELDILVKSFNHDSGKVEFKRVIDYQAKQNDGTKKWIKVKARRKSGEIVELVTTDDHPWFSKTDNVYIELKNLKIGDKVLFSDN